MPNTICTIIIALMILGMTSCSSSSTAITPTYPIPPTETITPIPPTITPTQPLAIPIVTATQVQLPVIYEVADYVYCQFPEVLLPISDAQGLSEDEITEKLMELSLAHFTAPEAPGFCRIDSYRIDEVSYDESFPFYILSPQGDFMRGVSFSVKLIQLPCMWRAYSGEIDQQNWLHTGKGVAVFRSTNGYTMKLANP